MIRIEDLNKEDRLEVENHGLKVENEMLREEIAILKKQLEIWQSKTTIIKETAEAPF